jgi:rubrerythrin
MTLPEQKRVVSALETSIMMEIDGKTFYMKASQNSTSKAGKGLFGQLAIEEDAHRTLFEQIYEEIRKEKGWPDLEVKLTPGATTLFSRDEPKDGFNAAPSGEIGAVQTALGMEIKSFEFYEAQMKTAESGSEMRFYRQLAAQERGHHLALIEYLEFLQDPASYFIKMEHHTLDGG